MNIGQAERQLGIFLLSLYQGNWRKVFLVLIISPAEKNRAKPEKQKGKKEGGWGEGIFALLRLKIERFRFSLIRRKPKQKIFHILLKEKEFGEEKNKECNEKISVLVCRSKAEASGNAPHYSGFCSKKVRISTKRYRQQKSNPPRSLFLIEFCYLLLA